MVTLDHHFWKCMLNSLRNVKFITIWKLTMFITAVCVIYFYQTTMAQEQKSLSLSSFGCRTVDHKFPPLMVVFLLFHIDIVFAWLSLERSTSSRRISVNISANYWHKLASNNKLAQWILRRIFPSHYKRSRFGNANVLPYISPSKHKPLKKALWKI